MPDREKIVSESGNFVNQEYRAVFESIWAFLIGVTGRSDLNFFPARCQFFTSITTGIQVDLRKINHRSSIIYKVNS